LWNEHLFAEILVKKLHDTNLVANIPGYCANMI